MKGKIMSKALKEIIFLRKQGFQEPAKSCRVNYPLTKGWLQKESKPAYSLWPNNTFLTPPLLLPERMPVPQISLNLLGHCSKHCLTLVHLASILVH